MTLDVAARCNGSACIGAGNPLASRHDNSRRMNIEEKPARVPSFLLLLIESVAAAGCALYPSSASITLMVEIEAQRERRRREQQRSRR